MIGIFSTARLAVGGVLIAGAVAGWFYVKNLQARLEIAETQLAERNAEIEQLKIARAFAEAAQADAEARAQETRVIRRVIRRDPDANDRAPRLLLDTVGRLVRPEDDRQVPAGAD